MAIGRVGQEFIVNSTATGGQVSPAITELADGRFVATWQSYDTGDGDSFTVENGAAAKVVS